MTIVAIDHVQLAMPAGGEDEARRFYRDLLELREVEKPAGLALRGGVWFEAGAVKLHLGVDVDFRPARRAHPGLLVEGLSALTERLKAAGCHVEPDGSLPGYDRIHVSDPFGNRLELMEPTGRPAD